MCLSKERNRNGGNRIRKSPKAEIVRETCLWLHVISCDVSKLFALNYVFLLVSPVLDCDDSLFVFCCFVSSTSNIHHGAVLPWEAFQTLKSNEHIDYHLLNFRACFMTFTIYSSSAKTIEVSELKSTLRDSSHLSASSRRAEVKIRCNNTHISWLSRFLLFYTRLYFSYILKSCMGRVWYSAENFGGNELNWIGYMHDLAMIK